MPTTNESNSLSRRDGSAAAAVSLPFDEPSLQVCILVSSPHSCVAFHFPTSLFQFPLAVLLIHRSPSHRILHVDFGLQHHLRQPVTAAALVASVLPPLEPPIR